MRLKHKSNTPVVAPDTRTSSATTCPATHTRRPRLVDDDRDVVSRLARHSGVDQDVLDLAACRTSRGAESGRPAGATATNSRAPTRPASTTATSPPAAQPPDLRPHPCGRRGAPSVPNARGHPLRRRESGSGTSGCRRGQPAGLGRVLETVPRPVAGRAARPRIVASQSRQRQRALRTTGVGQGRGSAVHVGEPHVARPSRSQDALHDPSPQRQRARDRGRRHRRSRRRPAAPCDAAPARSSRQLIQHASSSSAARRASALQGLDDARGHGVTQDGQDVVTHAVPGEARGRRCWRRSRNGICPLGQVGLGRSPTVRRPGGAARPGPDPRANAQTGHAVRPRVPGAARPTRRRRPRCGRSRRGPPERRQGAPVELGPRVVPCGLDRPPACAARARPTSSRSTWMGRPSAVANVRQNASSASASAPRSPWCRCATPATVTPRTGAPSSSARRSATESGPPERATTSTVARRQQGVLPHEPDDAGDEGGHGGFACRLPPTGTTSRG